MKYMAPMVIGWQIRKFEALLAWKEAFFVRFMPKLDKFQTDVRANILELQNWVDTFEVDDSGGEADTENSKRGWSGAGLVAR